MYVCMHVCQHRRATTGPQGGRRGTQHTHQQHRSKQPRRPGQHHNPAPQGHRGGRGIPTIHHAWGGWGLRSCTIYSHIYDICIYRYLFRYISIDIMISASRVPGRDQGGRQCRGEDLLGCFRWWSAAILRRGGRAPVHVPRLHGGRGRLLDEPRPGRCLDPLKRRDFASEAGIFERFEAFEGHFKAVFKRFQAFSGMLRLIWMRIDRGNRF